MRQVKCISPHAGLHRGDRRRGVPPSPAGYVSVPSLGRDLQHGRPVEVGSVIDAPEPPGFIADGFHFVDAATGEADQCAGSGDCWCGRCPPAPDAAPEIAPQPDDSAGDGAEES